MAEIAGGDSRRACAPAGDLRVVSRRRRDRHRACDARAAARCATVARRQSGDARSRKLQRRADQRAGRDHRRANLGDRACGARTCASRTRRRAGCGGRTDARGGCRDASRSPAPAPGACPFVAGRSRRCARRGRGGITALCRLCNPHRRTRIRRAREDRRGAGRARGAARSYAHRCGGVDRSRTPPPDRG